jgi:hypothetical protein
MIRIAANRHTGTVFHHGRWLFDFKLSCGQGCGEGSFAHERVKVKGSVLNGG